MNNPPTPRIAGGRLVPRPDDVHPCPACQEPAGANYRTCAACRHTIDALWQADWDALCAQRGILTGSPAERALAHAVIRDINAHVWTVVDIALTLVTCPECGEELCGGPLACENCKFIFDNLWTYDMEAGYQGVMSFNEHLIRVGRFELRHPHRFTDFAAEGAIWLMPIAITNPTYIVPSKMQTIYEAFQAGTLTYAETRWDKSLEMIYEKAVASLNQRRPRR